MNKTLLLISLMLITALTGCKSQEEKQAEFINNQTTLTQSLILNKKNHINTLPNAMIVNAYADKLEATNPEYKKIAETMRVEATKNSKALKDFSKRLNSVNKHPKNDNQFKIAADEIDSIQGGVKDYNNSLIDVANVLADLSNGKLHRIGGMTSSSTEKTRKGEELVGNPTYGHWQNDSNGTSFWAWYGMYSMFSNNRPFYQSHYYSHPSPSYYDYQGRNYSSRTWRSNYRSSHSQISSSTIRKPNYRAAPKKIKSSYSRRTPKATQFKRNTSSSYSSNRKVGSSYRGSSSRSARVSYRSYSRRGRSGK